MHYTSFDPKLRANAAFLIGAYSVSIKDTDFFTPLFIYVEKNQIGGLWRIKDEIFFLLLIFGGIIMDGHLILVGTDVTPS